MRTIELKSGEWRALIDICCGANCISLRNEKYCARLLREPPACKLSDGMLLYGMPILFPVNRIENGRFEFEGRQYAFPINEPQTGCHLHGELYKTEFNLAESSENKVKCSYKATKDLSYLGFPHEFEMDIEYEVREDGLHHTVTVTNGSTENMPIFLGFHTTFNSLFLKDSKPENIRVYADVSEEYERDMVKSYLPTGRKLAFDPHSAAISNGIFSPFSENISRLYRGTGVMKITDIESGLSIVYENDEKYKFRLIFNCADDGYICLEPQTCLVNCQNSQFTREEAGFDYLKPNESKTYRSKISLENKVLN